MVGVHLIIPGGTRVIDAAGKFVIPGGIDASVRLQKPYPKGNTGKCIWLLVHFLVKWWLTNRIG